MHHLNAPQHTLQRHDRSDGRAIQQSPARAKPAPHARRDNFCSINASGTDVCPANGRHEAELFATMLANGDHVLGEQGRLNKVTGILG